MDSWAKYALIRQTRSSLLRPRCSALPDYSPPGHSTCRGAHPGRSLCWQALTVCELSGIHRPELIPAQQRPVVSATVGAFYDPIKRDHGKMRPQQAEDRDPNVHAVFLRLSSRNSHSRYHAQFISALCLFFLKCLAYDRLMLGSTSNHLNGRGIIQLPPNASDDWNLDAFAVMIWPWLACAGPNFAAHAISLSTARSCCCARTIAGRAAADRHHHAFQSRR